MAGEGSNSTEHWPYIQAHLFGQLISLSSEREQSVSALRESVTPVTEGHLPDSDAIGYISSHPPSLWYHISESRAVAPEEKLSKMCAGVGVARKMGNSFCPCQGLVTSDTVGRKNQRRYLLMGDRAALKVTNTRTKHCSPGHRHWESPVHISESMSMGIKVNGDTRHSAYSLFQGMAGEQGHFPRLPAKACKSRQEAQRSCTTFVHYAALDI